MGEHEERRKLVSLAPNSLRGGLMIATAAAIWGTFSLFFRSAERLAEQAGNSLGPAAESFVFFGVVLVLLAPSSLRKPALKRPTREALVWLAFFTIADALNVLAYFSAMQKTSVAIAVVTHYSAPLFVAVLSPLLLKEAKPKGLWTFLSLGLVGLLLLIQPHRATASSSTAGALLGLASGLLFAGSMLSMKRLSEFFSSDQILTLHYPGALLILYFFIPDGQLANLGGQPLFLLILAGLLPGVLAGLLFVEGMRALSASRAGVLTLIEPLVAGLIGVLVWNERPGPEAYVGGLLVLAAAYLVITAKSADPAAA